MTHTIRVLAETGDTVTIGRSDFETLVRAAEDAEDLAALAEHDAEEQRIGRDDARLDYLSADETERLLDGESPLKLWREKRGLTQRALAKAARIQPGYLAEIETGRKPGSADALNRLSTALRVAMHDLMNKDQRLKALDHGPVLLVSTGRLAGSTSVDTSPSPKIEFATNAEAVRAARDQWQGLACQYPVILDKVTGQPIFRADELKDLIVDNYNRLRPVASDRE